MKSDIEIKDDIYQIIKGSALEKAVTGKLKKTRRPANSNKEDIVISFFKINVIYLSATCVHVLQI